MSIRNSFYSIEPPIRIIQRMELAERLKKAMHDCDRITQYALASKDRSGVPQPTINRILKGVSREPKRSTLYKLADALGVSRDWLVAEKGGQYFTSVKPPTLDETAWNALTIKQRALIEQVARPDTTEGVIDALHAVMAATIKPEATPRTISVPDRRKAQTVYFGHEDRRKRKDG